MIRVDQSYLNDRSCRSVRLVSLYFATRLAVLRRTLRPSVPTGVVLLCWRRTLFRWTPDTSLLVLLYYDGRTDRASLQESYCFAGDGLPSLDTTRAFRYFATRLAVLRRTLRPCVPTGVVLLWHNGCSPAKFYWSDRSGSEMSEVM